MEHDVPEHESLLKSRPGLRRLATVAGRGSGLSANAKLLYHWLVHLAGEDQKCISWPGATVVADLMGTDRHTASRAIANLVNDGFISMDTEKLCDETILTINEVRAESLSSLKALKVDKPSPLTDADRILACSSFQKMSRYLAFGQPGLHAKDIKGLEPTPLFWGAVPGFTTEDHKPELWTNQHFMGFWWYLVCWHWEQNKIPLRLPNWGRIAGAIKSSPLSKKQLHTHMNDIVRFFPAIKYLTSRSRFVIELDEASISNAIISEKMTVLRGMTRDEFAHVWNEATSVKQPIPQED